jgi:cytidine deaminase
MYTLVLELAEAARQARLSAYFPSSKFAVGAALHVENIYFELSFAEGVAVVSAVTVGEREFAC